VFGAEPIDQIPDLIFQPAVIDIGGNAGGELVYQLIKVLGLQAGGVGPVGQSVRNSGTIIISHLGLKLHVAVAFLTDRSAMFGQPVVADFRCLPAIRTFPGSGGVHLWFPFFSIFFWRKSA
jgi:hypothetical protein